jgi:alpha-L-glutamate ligase-like protein
MAKISSILGLNARNHLFQSRYNKASAKAIADSKIATKKFLHKYKFPTPKTFGIFKNFSDVPRFDWGSLTDNFVIKPTSSFGGEGIMVIKKRISGDEFLTINKEKINIDDLKLHVLDILEGRYSHRNLPGEAFIEERISIHPEFRRFTYQGTPDIRVIVFNKIPVMAMVRFPTAESEGKANIQQGAIGVGVDIATGRTTYGTLYYQPIKLVPGKNLRVDGLLIPFWTEILTMAIEIQEKIKKLGYLAVDFFIDKQRGPIVVELTARPGLKIQIANMAGLRRRLARVEGLEVDTPEKGIRIAKDLFGLRLGRKKKEELKVFERVKVEDKKRKRIEVEAKIDTGAFRSSIDRSFAKKLGLLTKKNILWRDYYRSALGREERIIIGITLLLGGKRLKTPASVANRDKMKTKIIIGRRDLKGYIIRP